MSIKMIILEVAMEEKKSFLIWVKEHKKQLIIAGVSVATIVGIILAIKNRESIMRMWESLRLAITKQPSKADEVKSMLSTTSVPISVPVIEVVPATEIMVIRTNGTARSPFDVREHLRNLPEGHHPSARKIIEAAESGIELATNQTLVSAHPRCYAA